MKRFNLKTYFTLVFMETSSFYLNELTEAFEESKLKEGGSHASKVVWSKIKELLSDKVFLIDLTDDFIGLIF